MAEQSSKQTDPILTQMQERVRKASSSLKSERKQIKQRRSYMRGNVGDDGEKGLVRTNLIFSTVHGLIPFIYAKNPELSITPQEAVEDDGYQAVGKFCDTLEIVVQRQLKNAALKAKAKRTVRASLVTGQGWVKLSYQRDIEHDQAIIDRIADAQDNMQRLRHELKELEEGNRSEREEELREVELLTTALEAKVEVVKAEGLALDTIRREDIVVDPAIKGVQDYHLARWIAQRIYMHKDDAESTYGLELGKATTYSSENEELSGVKDNQDKGGDLIIVYELWDRTNQHVFTFTEGHDQWLREPYTPTRCGEQFFPFIPLVMLEDDEGKDIAMIDMLKELQDEYNTTRTNLAEHRKNNVPHWIGDDQLKVKHVNDFAGAQTGDITMLDTGGRPLRDMIQPAPILPLNAATYDTAPIRTDIEMVSGLQDAMRGAVSKAKTATEAQIMQSGASGRVGEMQDCVEDWLEKLFKLASEILLQELSVEQVQRIAGVGAVWSSLPKSEVFDMVNIEIRAGSSGKPDKASDRESWAQIMPVLQEMYMQISQLEMQGGNGEPLRNLMRETLSRFDERINVDEFIPPSQQQMPQQQMQEQPLQQQPQQMMQGDNIGY
ncbi:MAG: hypothetical protein R8M45_05745 [Ghiorsea sp.]